MAKLENGFNSFLHGDFCSQSGRKFCRKKWLRFGFSSFFFNNKFLWFKKLFVKNNDGEAWSDFVEVRNIIKKEGKKWKWLPTFRGA